MRKTSSESFDFTPRMASTQDVETSVANNSPSQDSSHPHHHLPSRYTSAFAFISIEIFESFFSVNDRRSYERYLIKHWREKGLNGTQNFDDHCHSNYFDAQFKYMNFRETWQRMREKKIEFIALKDISFNIVISTTLDSFVLTKVFFF